MPFLKGLEGKFTLSFLFGVGSPEEQKAPEMFETCRKYQPAQKNATDIWIHKMGWSRNQQRHQGIVDV